MKSAPSEPSDLVNRLRQQLILAQVRIMELEDARDSLTPRLAELEKLLRQAQALADQKLDEAAHLGKVLADCQAQCAQLQQAHQLAGQEIASVRTALAESSARANQQSEAIARLEISLRVAEAGVLAVKSSRSWRWTAWLRALEGKPGGRGP